MTIRRRPYRRIVCGASSALLWFAAPVPVSAQTAATEQDGSASLTDIQQQQGARTAETSAGEIGQRQTRDEVEGVAPLARISNRIRNRVQLRINNRIDRNYDLPASTSSAFAVAEDQARAAAGPR